MSSTNSAEQKRIDSIRMNGGLQLKRFQPQNITYDMCKVAVENDAEAIWYVPDELLTDKLCETACNASGLMLQRVPVKMRTARLCLIAVSSDGRAVQYVPELILTEDLCLTAVCNNALAFRLIPEKYISAEFVANAMNISPLGTDLIPSLPKSVKSTDFYMQLVKLKPEIIWKLPKQARTATLCKAAIQAMHYHSVSDAVKDTPELLSRLHTSLYDYDTCKAFIESGYISSDISSPAFCANTFSDNEKGYFYVAGKRDYSFSIPHLMKWPSIRECLLNLNPEFLCFVDPNSLTAELCASAFHKSTSGCVFHMIPDKYKTYEMSKSAVCQNPQNISLVPELFWNEELFLISVEKDGNLLNNVPEDYRTEKVCLAAVSNRGSAIQYVPEHIISQKLCLLAIQNSDFFSLAYIPEHFRNYDLFLASVKKKIFDFKYVPDCYKTYEMCLCAVKGGETELGLLPPDYFTEEFCKELLAHNVKQIKMIPKQKLTEQICEFSINLCDETNVKKVFHEIAYQLRTQSISEKAVQLSFFAFEDVPEQVVTKDMIIDIAKRAKGRTCDNIPMRFRTKEFLEYLKSAFGLERQLEIHRIHPIDSDNKCDFT